eukprot:g47468.t1
MTTTPPSQSGPLRRRTIREASTWTVLLGCRWLLVIVMHFQDVLGKMADGCERWWGELLNHPLLDRLKKGDRHLDDPAKNLVFCVDSDLFFWDVNESVFYAANLRNLNASIDSYQ